MEGKTVKRQNNRKAKDRRTAVIPHMSVISLLRLKRLKTEIIQRENEHERGAERGGERESQADCTLSTEPDVGLGPRP